MTVKQSLEEIGFQSDKIDLAIAAVGENLEQATEWILTHGINDDNSPSSGKLYNCNFGDGEKSITENEKPEKTDEIAKSLKCDVCSKLFKSAEEAEFHAVKSGHASFSESTEEKQPLTEAEKKQRLADLEVKLAARRIEKEENEKKETIERERKRIQMGKNITDVKLKMQEKEIKQLAEERRRDRIEDNLARQRVKDQIEADRQARREAMQKLQNPHSEDQHKTPVSVTATNSNTSSASSTAITKKNYEHTRLQVRLPTGPPIVQEFKSKEPLSAVRLWVSLQQNIHQNFTLATTYPRKIFSDEDMEKPLNILGLVPSAVLLVNNCKPSASNF